MPRPVAKFAARARTAVLTVLLASSIVFALLLLWKQARTKTVLHGEQQQTINQKTRKDESN